MTARDVMAKSILDAGRNMGALAHLSAKTFEGKIVEFQLHDLKAAGYSIVHESEIQELRKEAARYRWLRDGNAYAPEEWMITGGPVLDQFIDESIRERALPDGGVE